MVCMYIYIFIPTTLYNLKMVLDVSLLRSTMRPLRGYMGPCFQLSSPVGFSWISWAFLDFPSFKSPSRYVHIYDIFIHAWTATVAHFNKPLWLVDHILCHFTIYTALQAKICNCPERPSFMPLMQTQAAFPAG